MLLSRVSNIKLYVISIAVEFMKIYMQDLQGELHAGVMLLFTLSRFLLM